jgi:hypothetical protein
MGYLFQDRGKQKKAKYKANTKKGGNFLGAVGELVAPSGWETFATTAGLFALDRADAALRRGKSTKSSAKKGGTGEENNNNNKNILNNLKLFEGNKNILNNLKLFEVENKKPIKGKGENNYNVLQRKSVPIKGEVENKKTINGKGENNYNVLQRKSVPIKGEVENKKLINGEGKK